METLVLSFENDDPYRVEEENDYDPSMTVTVALPKELATRLRAAQKEWDDVQAEVVKAVKAARRQ